MGGLADETNLLELGCGGHTAADVYTILSSNGDGRNALADILSLVILTYSLLSFAGNALFCFHVSFALLLLRLRWVAEEAAALLNAQYSYPTEAAKKPSTPR
jgi:hypothetical protein